MLFIFPISLHLIYSSIVLYSLFSLLLSYLISSSNATVCSRLFSTPQLHHENHDFRRTPAMRCTLCTLLTCDYQHTNQKNTTPSSFFLFSLKKDYGKKKAQTVAILTARWQYSNIPRNQTGNFEIAPKMTLATPERAVKPLAGTVINLKKKKGRTSR